MCTADSQGVGQTYRACVVHVSLHVTQTNLSALHWIKNSKISQINIFLTGVAGPLEAAAGLHAAQQDNQQAGVGEYMCGGLLHVGGYV